jgi:hypothetical protein
MWWRSEEGIKQIRLAVPDNGVEQGFSPALRAYKPSGSATEVLMSQHQKSLPQLRQASYKSLAWIAGWYRSG